MNTNQEELYTSYCEMNIIVRTCSNKNVSQTDDNDVTEYGECYL